MKNDRMVIRKIHLFSLMNVLSDIYNRGVDFIDIYGIIENDRDTVGISFAKDYMDKDLEDNFDLFPNGQTSREHTKFSDEDLNQLI